jgi:phosphatidylglycerophosphate synthase
VADALSAARVVLSAAVVTSGVAGQGRLACLMVVVAAVTDVLDGRCARRLGPSRVGRQLDAVADSTLLVSTAAALVLLHPDMAGQGGLLIAVGVVFAAGASATWWASRRIADPRQVTAKVAGGTLYGFALFTLATGDYEAALLTIAAGALTVSSADAILRAIASSQHTWTASRQRSQAPHAGKGVVSRPAATASSATSTRPSTSESRP